MQDQVKTNAQLIAELDTLRQRNAELEAREVEHQRAQQVQNALYRITDATSAVQDMEDFYAAMHGIVDELMVAPNFYIALYDEARNMINFPFYLDEQDDGDRPDPYKWHRMGLDEARGFTAYVLRSGQPLLAHREKGEELIQSGEVELLGTLPESWLGVPLKAGGRVLGAVVVQSYSQEARHSEEDKDLLVFVAQHIAVALERARLLADTHQRNAELSVINSVQRALATELDMHVIYDLVGDQIMDGFSVLARLNEDEVWRNIPVVVISATNDMESVAKGIELGAEDYLPKPSDPVLLQARINAGLEKKRLRDQEVEYLRQVKKLTDAALAVETNSFDAESLSTLAARDDALGHLARVFERMAREVHAREQRLKQQIEQLRLDIEERQAAATQTAAAYIPIDRRHALVKGQALPEKTRGAALFADISGFVPLTSALAGELGPQRGAEELTRQLDRVYGALIHEVHRYGGSVVNFSGDAITCWFDSGKTPDVSASRLEATSEGSVRDLAGLRAIACALAMQAVMGGFATVLTPAQTAISLAIKVTVATGPVRRLLVGDPQIQQIEALAGHVLDELAMGETLANRGETLVQAALADAAGQEITIGGWRSDETSGARFAIVTGLRGDVAPAPWPDSLPRELPDEQARPWLLAPVYDMVHSGRGDFLAELRSATALFLKFEGLDYEGDDEVGANLDCFVRWVQAVLARHDGYLVQLTVGDKGSYLLAAFGAPLGLEDHVVRAVTAALELQATPERLDFVTGVRIGLASGQMRVGAYGSQARRAYGVLGDKTNLAARLMQAADGRILCDEAVYRAARSHLSFEPLPSIALKGVSEPVAVYAPTRENEHTWYKSRINQLPPGPQLTLKVASLIGSTFSCSMLQAIYPIEADRRSLCENLRILEEQGMVELRAAEPELTYGFAAACIQEAAYNLMLFAQRRQLHRTVAEWYERTYADDAACCYPLLAHHWRSADEPGKAIHYLEKAAEQARRNGDDQGALRFLNEALEIEAHASVLSDEYHSDFSI